MIAGKLFIVLISAALVNNVILSRFLGLCPFLGISKSIKTAAGMGGAVVFVITIASVVCSTIYMTLLEPRGLTYLNTIVFILVIACLVQVVEMVMKKMMHSLYEALGIYLPLITTNCAVLGIALENVQEANPGMNRILYSVVNGVGASLGFCISIILMAGIRERIQFNDITKSFKGMPIVLVTASLMAIAFCGFSGLI